MEEQPRRIITVEEVEELIRQLPSVQAVRVVVSDWGAIEEIHVLAGSDRPAKQIVRDVESCLMARWGMVIDHKCISVAQLVQKEPSPFRVRVRLMSVHVLNNTIRHLTRVEVNLGLLDPATGEPVLTCQGADEGGDMPLAIWFTAASAAVKALNQLADPGWEFSAQGATCQEVGGQQVAVVTLILLNPRGDDEALAGAAVVKGERVEAFVKATLDAANRRLGKACAQQSRRKWSEVPEGEESGEQGAGGGSAS
ncbi:MAG: hypothetical protein AB1503_00260 [Bacillota bacterium]|nr:hypothetical protein [Bacillota bacterium]